MKGFKKHNTYTTALDLLSTNVKYLEM